MSDYSKMYKDPRWQRKRLEIMERDGFCCASCGSGENDGVTLNVHHKVYEKGKMAWEYDDARLVTLCKNCHENFHAAVESIKHNSFYFETIPTEILHAFAGLLLACPARHIGLAVEIIEMISFVCTSNNQEYQSKCIRDTACNLMLIAEPPE